MFDNLREPDDSSSYEEDYVPEKPLNQKKKKVIRFRFPIYIDSSFLVEQALEEYLTSETIYEETISYSPMKPNDVFLTRAYVRDAEGRTYKAYIPQVFERYNLKKPKE